MSAVIARIPKGKSSGTYMCPYLAIIAAGTIFPAIGTVAVGVFHEAVREGLMSQDSVRDLGVRV